MEMKCWLELQSDLVENKTGDHNRCEANYQATNNGFSISWEEIAEESSMVIHSYMNWDNHKQRLTVSRKSERETKLSFIEKKETTFHVGTEFGIFDGTIQTHQIKIQKNEKLLSYCVFIDYDLVFQQQTPQRNKMEMFFGFLEEKHFFQESSRILA